MPDVRNCRKCGRIFNYIGGIPLCPSCKKQDEEDFQRVKNYLYENPGATMTQVSTELGVSIETIKRYLKDGRLEITDDNGNLVLECENCGKSIRSGRFCPECERILASELKTVAKQFESKLDKDFSTNKKKFGMRYLNKYYEREKEEKD